MFFKANMFKRFPFYKQHDSMDCGPTCLRMMAKYYGKSYSLKNLRERCHVSIDGASLLDLSQAAESIGFRTLGARLSYEVLEQEAPMPCIVHWNDIHYVIVTDVRKDQVHIVNPTVGKLKLSKEAFLKGWVTRDDPEKQEGNALLLEPSPVFYEMEESEDERPRVGMQFFFSYLRPYKKFYLQLILDLFLATLISLIVPFLNQSIVDVGIMNENMGFIYLIFVAQVVMFLAGMAKDFIKGWILLHITSRLNISLKSDFLTKLMRLPVSFFSRKMIGDITGRLADHQKIQNFITGTALNTIFDVINVLVFLTVLFYYNATIGFILLGGTLLYFGWVLLFLNKKKELNHQTFDLGVIHQNNLLDLLYGMQEIKLQNCEIKKRWEWERIQAKMYKLETKRLRIHQIEEIGANFINQSKNILISFFTAKAVIDGDMTLGMMLSTAYIVGMVDRPFMFLISVINQAQDAGISLERIAEIHDKKNEEVNEHEKIAVSGEELNQDVVFDNVSFQYDGPNSPFVLKNINLTIPKGKVTAIVGLSGSGKTTLLKLLLKYYEVEHGELKLGNININNIRNRDWRSNFGSVLQESHIFSDTIAGNIGIAEDKVDKDRLKKAVDTANIREFIEQLPQGYNTKIGKDGKGMSQGQKQRILIARAVYKNAQFLLLDEATNSMDANNEKTIINNLNKVFIGKTVVVVAHRLSTVKDADQIVVLKNGTIRETGTHAELVLRQGDYYELVKNQLELEGAHEV